jgi:hypothetical protein
MTMTLIETKTLSSAAASIEFTSIPQDGTDLYLLTSLRDTAAIIGSAGARLIFNGNGTGSSRKSLTGNASSATSDSESTIWVRYGQHPGANATANTFSNDSVYIPNYSGSTNKSVSADAVGENNASGSDSAYQVLTAGLWANTAPITSLQVQSNSTSFAAGSTFSLYKITKGSDGIVTTS